MAITTEDNIAGGYPGNGSVVEFATPKFQANADIRAILVNDATLVETLQALNIDYTLTGAGEDDGGTLTMTTAPASGTTLYITVDPPQTQRATIAGSLATTEALDKLTQLIQQLQLTVDRAVKIPEAERLAGSVAGILGDAATRANKLLSFDASGNIQNAQLSGDNVADGGLPIAKLADGTANRLLGYDASGNVTEIAPDATVQVTDGTISSSGGGGGGGGGTLDNIVEDVTPQLGGDLDVNGQSIVSVSNGNIVIAPNGSGRVSLDGLLYPIIDGSANQAVMTNGSGSLFIGDAVDYAHATFSTASPAYDPSSDRGIHALVDCSSTAVDIQLPDTAGVSDQTQPLILRCNSAANLASITCAVSGQLRSRNHRQDHDGTADTVYIGFSQAAQEGSVVYIFKRSSVWQVTGHLRENSGDNIHFDADEGVTADMLAPGIRRLAPNTENANFTFAQSDERLFTDWTGGTTATVPLLATGTVLNGRRNAGGASNGTLSLTGGVTTSDSLTITDGNVFSILYIGSEVVIRQS